MKKIVTTFHSWILRKNLILQAGGHRTSKPSWYSQSTRNFGFLGWCHDHDFIQGAYTEESLAPYHPSARRQHSHPGWLAEGICFNCIKLHNMVHMVYNAGLLALPLTDVLAACDVTNLWMLFLYRASCSSVVMNIGRHTHWKGIQHNCRWLHGWILLELLNQQYLQLLHITRELIGRLASTLISGLPFME